MGQRLRVVGVLHFGNKAQLTKGLLAFTSHQARGFFEAEHWKIDQLQARIAIDTELPGDFEAVEAGFMEMVRVARHGYIDYFEEGNTRIRGGGTQLVKRWACSDIDRRFKFIFPEGTEAVSFPGDDGLLILSGSLAFADEKSAMAAQALLPVRLPYLRHEGTSELRLGRDAFAIGGLELSCSAQVFGPTEILCRPLIEALSVFASKAKRGKIEIRGSRLVHSVAAGGKYEIARAEGPRPTPLGLRITPVDAREPLWVNGAIGMHIERAAIP